MCNKDAESTVAVVDDDMIPSTMESRHRAEARSDVRHLCSNCRGVIRASTTVRRRREDRSAVGKPIPGHGNGHREKFTVCVGDHRSSHSERIRVKLIVAEYPSAGDVSVRKNRDRSKT